MANNFLDSSLNRGAAATVTSSLSSAQSQNIGTTGFEFPDEDDVSVPWYQSLGEAFTDSGLVTGGIKAIQTGTEEEEYKKRAARTYDPNFSMEAYFGSRPDRLKQVQPFLDNPEDPAAGSLLDLLVDVNNADHMDIVLDRLQLAQERAQNAADNPIASTLGMIGGIGLDVVAALLVAPAGIPAMTVGAGVRIASAGRLAAIAAAEAGGERAVQSITNPLISDTDILTNAGIGLGLGAALGLVFPTAMGRVALRKALEPRRVGGDEAVEEALATRPGAEGSVGAAKTDDEFQIPAAGAGSVVVKYLDRVGVGPKVLRNPKRVLADIGVRGRKFFGLPAAQRQQGDRVYYNVMSRLLRMSIANQNEVGGKLAKARTAEDELGLLELARVTRNEEATLEYRAALKDVFADKRPIRGTLEVPGGRLLNEKLGRSTLTEAQFHSLADEIAIANGDTIRLELETTKKAKRLAERIETLEKRFDSQQKAKKPDLEKVEKTVKDLEKARADADKAAQTLETLPRREWDFPEEYRSILTPDEMRRLRPHLEKSAAKEDDYYQRLGELEAELGLIKPEELIPGYRPQRWNKDEILRDIPAFNHLMRKVIQKNPNDDWVRETVKIKDKDGVIKSVLDEDETFDDLAKRDPELAEEIADEWSAMARREAEDSLHEAAIRLSDEEAKLRVGQADDIEQRLLRQQDEIAGKIDRAEAELRRLRITIDHKNPEGRRALVAERIQRLERQFFDKEAQLLGLKSARDVVEDLTHFIKVHGNAGQKAELGVAMKRAGAAWDAEARAANRKIVSEEIDRIRDNILDNKNPWGHVNEKFVKSSRRFQRRSLRLDEHRFTPEARRFLLTNSKDARASFGASVDPQIAIKKTFGTEDIDEIRRAALAGYMTDAQRFGDDPGVARRLKQAGEIFDALLAEFTHADVTKVSALAKNTADLASMANTITAFTSLGGVALAQIGDLALTAVAGGRLGAGFKSLFTPRHTRQIFKEIFENDAEMAVLLRGPQSLDSARFRTLNELDNPGFNVPGGKFRAVQHRLDQVAVVEGWANLMHVWNQWVRGSFGLDFARQINDDLANFGNLPGHLKTYYAKLGFDADEAARYTRLLQSKNTKFANGKLLLPDSKAWAKTDPDMLQRYQIAIKTAGDEAMISPSVGDRPFLRSFPGGRMILQFQSFMFTAGERFVAPMIQEGFLHPTSIRPYTAALLGVLAGAVSDGLKETAKGRGEEWLDRWTDGDGEGFRDNMWAAVLRSPLMAGPSSMLTEVASTQLGRRVNNMIEAGTGARPFREAASRLGENQGLYSLLGPTSTNLLGTLPSISKKLLDGDLDKAEDQISRRFPVLNVFYLQTLKNYMER